MGVPWGGKGGTGKRNSKGCQMSLYGGRYADNDEGHPLDPEGIPAVEEEDAKNPAEKGGASDDDDSSDDFGGDLEVLVNDAATTVEQPRRRTAQETSCGDIVALIDAAKRRCGITASRVSRQPEEPHNGDFYKQDDSIILTREAAARKLIAMWCGRILERQIPDYDPSKTYTEDLLGSMHRIHPRHVVTPTGLSRIDQGHFVMEQPTVGVLSEVSPRGARFTYLSTHGHRGQRRGVLTTLFLPKNNVGQETEKKTDQQPAICQQPPQNSYQ